MAAVLDEALKRSGAELFIVGHTDTQGAGPANDALSLRRAQDVQAMFVQRGFPANRIESAGRGERELAVPTPDNVAEPRNRRVEILVR
jgi:outer membrane protein OmpA-like peptidoglycan-associated protein